MYNEEESRSLSVAPKRVLQRAMELTIFIIFIVIIIILIMVTRNLLFISATTVKVQENHIGQKETYRIGEKET